MKRGNKKGQFYLLAAIIIITVIVGFAAISNYAKKKSSVKIYDLKDELQIESGEVLEYGVSYSEEDLKKTIDDFIEKYQEYAGKDKDLYFIFGNTEKIWMITFEEVTKGVIKDTSSGTSINIEDVQLWEESLTIKEGKVIATINNIEYEFELKPGENFFFVISQEVEGEQHIVIS